MDERTDRVEREREEDTGKARITVSRQKLGGMMESTIGLMQNWQRQI